MDPINEYIESLNAEDKTCAVHRLLGALSSMVTDEQAKTAIKIASSRPYYPMTLNLSEYEPF